MRSKLFSKRTSEYRSVKQTLLKYAFVFVLSMALLGFAGIHVFSSHSELDNPSVAMDASRRSLLGSFKTPDAFTPGQRTKGAFLLHLVGIFYMFLAIAIVCDEFFVPAIEIIVDKLKMSPDTAGATFMAAGGSAPELFTSFIGTFITKDGVGFGTIVGSAVFNVLFVIGCCAIFSTGELKLTWWPFARDSSYYCMCLLLLAIFFGIASAERIYWYESVILLVLYFAYVTMMMNNETIWQFLKSKLEERKRKQAGSSATMDEDETQEDLSAIKVTRPLQFNVRVFDLMTRDATLEDIAGIHMVSRIKGDVRATFRQVDENEDGTIDIDEFRKVLRRLGRHLSAKDVQQCFDEIDENKNGKIEFDEFERWYVRSTWRMKQDIEAIFTKFDFDDSGKIDVTELYELLKAVNHAAPSETEVSEAKELLDENKDGQVSLKEFMEWYEHSVYFEKELKRRETVAKMEEDTEKDGLSLAMPQNTWGRVFWVVCLPIVVPLYFTVPDVRRPKWTKWYAVSFVMSIAWLGFYSYWMVAWSGFFGRVTKIPPPVMGLTLLAAGTSVPDLLTSIIVARNGEGDMAVSSSIGSNIFDVLVGLPLPWFLFAVAATKKGYVKVVADSLFISIFVLFAMIFAVLMIIIKSNWRMTKTLGYAMFVLYFVFVIQDLLRTYLA